MEFRNHIQDRESTDIDQRPQTEAEHGEKMFCGIREKNADRMQENVFEAFYLEWDEPETADDYIKLQDEEIDRVECGEKALDTTQEKGNYGEMKADQALRETGKERISLEWVIDIDQPGHQGIDGVYHNPNGIPKYLIVDAKYGTAVLSETADGRQLSEKWIDQRLDAAVGKERADEIRMEKLLDAKQVGVYVAHVDSEGNVTFDRLDGNITEKDVKLS